MRRRGVSRFTLGAAVIGVLVLSCGLVFTGLLQKAARKGGRDVNATFATTARLAVGSPVRVRGVEAGRVKSMRYDAATHTARATLTVFDDAGPLHADARAAIRWRTVLGANYAVNLDPGTPSAGPLPSSGIDRRHTSSQVEVDQLLAALQADPRVGLRTMLAELPQALQDPHGLQRAGRALGAAAPTVGRAVGDLRGSEDGDLRRLVAGTARTVRGLDTTRQTVRDVVEGGAATLRTTSNRAADIEAALQRLGGDQPAIRTTLRRLDGTLDAADPLIASLDKAAPAVAPTAARLRPLLVDADRLLGRAEPLVTSLRPAARSLASASADGAPVLRDLSPALDRLTRTILPDLAKKDQVTGRATYMMVGPTIASITAAAASFDGVSHMVTLSGGGGERSLDTLPCSSYFTDPTAKQLTTCEDIGTYLKALLGGGGSSSSSRSRKTGR